MAEQQAQERLERAHRQQQGRLAGAVSRLAETLWRLNVKGPGVGTDQYLAQLSPLIERQYAVSASLARTYYGTSRRLALTPGSWTLPDVDPVEAGAIRSTLIGSGVKALTEAMDRDEDLAGALDKAGGLAARAAMRLTLSGGRSYIQRTAHEDQRAVAYMWMTRDDGEDPCSWCAMLESRGPVYTRESWPEADPRPGGLLKVSAHEGCLCHLGMVWSRSQPLPERTAELEAAWRKQTKGFSGQDAINAWRRWYDRERQHTTAANSAA